MKKSAKSGGKGWRFIELFLAAVFLFSAAMLIREGSRYFRERKANQRLSERIGREREELSAAGGTSSPYASSGRLLIYDGLWQENHDLVGWLTIEGLGIDLPVMYTPASPEYYLHRSFDGEYARSGSLFLGESWEPEANYAVIYGHNMKDGSMFGELDRYQNPEYARKHPVIRFDTLTREREYRVLTAFYSQAADSSQEDIFRYDQFTGLEEREGFEDYLRQVWKLALYDTGEEAEYGDRLLILSTCSYHKKTGRFVVVACQKAEI